MLEAEAVNSITAPLTVRVDPLASGGQYIGTDDGSGDERALARSARWRLDGLAPRVSRLLGHAGTLAYEPWPTFDPALLIEAMMHGAGPTADTPARMVTLPLSLMCVVSVQFNCLLALFNLIPVPPLDGSSAIGLVLGVIALLWLRRTGQLRVG